MWESHWFLRFKLWEGLRCQWVPLTCINLNAKLLVIWTCPMITELASSLRQKDELFRILLLAKQCLNSAPQLFYLWVCVCVRVHELDCINVSVCACLCVSVFLFVCMSISLNREGDWKGIRWPILQENRNKRQYISYISPWLRKSSIFLLG